ncbi:MULTISPECIES: hypothetical protein [Bradyrhizobium]|uniref:hypothetical protein n=1 Tax=Bradyrhizobium TaxID=374 RepID=UPI000D73396F|nr:hypothetical protein [Bradyrhizobium diazoefficiens]AWO87806.1 hypothetical protein DI395_03995 [Bradyrhizobium diazoefficiens]
MRFSSAILRSSIAIAIVACWSEAGLATGAGDFLDYCKSYQGKYKSASASIEGEIGASQKLLEGYYKDPSTLPEKALADYRKAVRIISFKNWEESATAQALLKTLRKGTDPSAYFFKEIYPKEMTEAQEVTMAQKVFKYDYETRLRPKLDEDVKKVRANLAEAKDNLDKNCKPDVVSQVFRGTIGRVLLTYEGNKQAAKNEKGDLAHFIRLTSGISLTDIARYGLRGGPNSELAKLGKTWTDGLDSVGIGKNSVIRQFGRAVDPTNLNVPKPLQITVDRNTGSNILRNATFGLAR